MFFGSPEEAVPALELVASSGHEIAAVYTRPDRPAGRSRKPRPTPVRSAAESLGMRVETPYSLRGEETQRELAACEADAFVVVAYGRFLPPEVLSMPRLGVVNIHPSLLPLYRGPSPVTTAILEGASQTGVTLMFLDEGMDTGPILQQLEGASQTGVTLMFLDEGMDTGPILRQSDPVPLDGTEKSGELTEGLFRLGAEMLPGALNDLSSGSLLPEPQDDSQATVTRLIEKEDGRIDWSKSAIEIDRAVRAYDPWPGAFTMWDGKTLKILDTEPLAGGNGAPGSISVKDRHIYVSTGSGRLEIISLQLEGKRKAEARDFLNGNPGFDKAVLGA